MITRKIFLRGQASNPYPSATPGKGFSLASSPGGTMDGAEPTRQSIPIATMQPKITRASRRAFLKGFGAATIAAIPGVAMAARTSMPDVISDTKSAQLNINARRNQAYRNRLAAAAADRKVKTPPHPNNGDETLYPNGIANYTKGFLHDQPCIVDAMIYAQYLAAIRTGKRADFDALVTS